MSAEQMVGRIDRWQEQPGAMAPADRPEQAVAPGTVGSPRDQAGPGSSPLARAGKAAAPMAIEALEMPATVEVAHKAGKAASPFAAGEPERQAPTPGWREVGYQPWALWAAHIPGTGLSGCCPGVSSRCLIADRVSSAGEVAPGEGTFAGIEEVPRAYRFDKVAASAEAVNMTAEMVAGTAAWVRRRERLEAAPTS